jgi:hypothetical protein
MIGDPDAGGDQHQRCLAVLPDQLSEGSRHGDPGDGKGERCSSLQPVVGADVQPDDVQCR